MRLLLLAGTHDSAHIAGALAREHRVAAIASVPRGVRAPVPLGLPTRIGGWGGEASFRDWLEREGVRAILDATHPFATGISGRAYRASEELGLDYLRFQRPSWKPGAEDRWAFLNDCGEVEQKIPEGTTVMIDTDGWGNDRIGALAGRTVHCRLAIGRQAPSVGNGNWHYLMQREPCDLDGEMFLYDRLKLDWIVLPNVGGAEGSPKLEAARRLGINLGLVRRPPQTGSPRVETVSEVMHWVRRRL